METPDPACDTPWGLTTGVNLTPMTSQGMYSFNIPSIEWSLKDPNRLWVFLL